MSDNRNLCKAQSVKNDEFYTRFEDIQAELQHYKTYLKNKVIYCNCDNPYESNFVKYFILNFNSLKLKKLIATCYAKPCFKEKLSIHQKPYKLELEQVNDNEDFDNIIKNNPSSLFLGDGDFRSDECVNLLKQADIIITNPPFSLFREYISQLLDHNKNFIIIGHVIKLAYRKIFKLIADDKLWLGSGRNNSSKLFKIPDEFVDKYNSKYKKIPIRWYTNTKLKREYNDLILSKHYTPEEYPKYDNYDAIEVSKVADIPCDFAGVMGVPITFLDKYNPEQFEILELRNSDKYKTPLCINGKEVFVRILIKNRHPLDI